MSVLAKRLCWIGFGVIVFGVVTTILAQSVSYKPWGVPDALREEYEARVSQIKRGNQMLSDTKNGESAVAEFPETSHDFGVIDPHTTASHSFLVRNTGDGPLSVQVRETSCKCTVGELGNSLVMPGKETSITLTWNTGYKAEQYTQTATIRTNDPSQKTVTLSVKGTVRADLIVPEEVELPKTDRGEVASASFPVYSQLWDDFEVLDVDFDSEGFEWFAEPLDLSDSLLADLEPKSAWKVTVRATMLKSELKGVARVRIAPDTGEQPLEREISIFGKARSPIAFYHPEISAQGLDIGTLTSEPKDQEIHLSVRVRGAYKDREMAVLDVSPEQLEARIKKLDGEGVYRLTISIPANCPFVTFNRESHHGYVQVGDPADESLQNWFPLYGAVVSVSD